MDRACSVGLGRQPFHYPIILPTGLCVSHDDARRAAATLRLYIRSSGVLGSFLLYLEGVFGNLSKVRNFVLSKVTGGPDALRVAFGTSVFAKILK